MWEFFFIGLSHLIIQFLSTLKVVQSKLVKQVVVQHTHDRSRKLIKQL